MRRGSPRWADVGSWTFSILIHAFSLGAAIVVAAEFSRIPRPNTFQWDVSLIVAPAPQPVVSSAPVVSHTSPVSPSIAPDSHRSARDVPRPTSHSDHESERTVAKPKAGPLNARLQTDSAILADVVNGEAVLQGSNGAAVDSEPEPEIEEFPAALGSDAPQENADTMPVDLASLPASHGEPDELPPPKVDEPEHIAPVSEPSVREPERLAYRPTPQVRDPIVSRTLHPDYGWLANVLFAKVQQIKRYPYLAKSNRWEGDVVLQAVITEDGEVRNILVVQSSGYSMLDQDAIALLERSSPVRLDHPLGRPQVTVQIPIGYRLE